jgi:hypothetical protein
MKYLADTNVLSEAVKLIPDRSVLNMIGKHRNEILTAAPVWHELQYGCFRLPVSRKRKIIESYLNDLLNGTCQFFRMMTGLPNGTPENGQGWHPKDEPRRLQTVRLQQSPK